MRIRVEVLGLPLLYVATGEAAREQEDAPSVDSTLERRDSPALDWRHREPDSDPDDRLGFRP